MPMCVQRCAAVLAVFCLLAAQTHAEEELRLKWNELAPRITGKSVRLSFKSGVRLAGSVRNVDPAGLQLEVTDTSDGKAYPKGPVLIPRSVLATIEVKRPAGHKGIVIGGAVGGGIAAAAGGTLLAIKRNEGGTGGDGIIAAAIVGPLVIGLLVGWSIDRVAHRGGQRITIVED